MGSSPIRHFNRTLQQTYGLIRGRQVPARHTDATFNIREMAPFRQPVPRGGRAAQPLVVANVGLSAVAAQSILERGQVTFAHCYTFITLMQVLEHRRGNV